jgi:hypothetical protein
MHAYMHVRIYNARNIGILYTHECSVLMCEYISVLTRCVFVFVFLCVCVCVFVCARNIFQKRSFFFG